MCSYMANACTIGRAMSSRLPAVALVLCAAAILGSAAARAQQQAFLATINDPILAEATRDMILARQFRRDVFAKGLRGKDAQAALERANITANRNAIPFDVNPPFNPSGMRFGSPAVTTRGFREREIYEVAQLIAKILDHIQSEEVVSEVRSAVRVLTDRFPLYAWKLTPAAFR